MLIWNTTCTLAVSLPVCLSSYPIHTRTHARTHARTRTRTHTHTHTHLTHTHTYPHTHTLSLPLSLPLFSTYITHIYLQDTHDNDNIVVNNSTIETTHQSTTSNYALTLSRSYVEMRSADCCSCLPAYRRWLRGQTSLVAVAVQLRRPRERTHLRRNHFAQTLGCYGVTLCVSHGFNVLVANR